MNTVIEKHQELIQKINKNKQQKEIYILNKDNNKTFTHEVNMSILCINRIEDINSLSIHEAHKVSLKNILQKKNFDSKKEISEIISFLHNDTEFYIGVIGITHEREKINHEGIKNNFGKIINFIQSKKIQSIHIEIASSIFHFISADICAEILQSTLLLKLYHFNIFITDPKKLTFTDFTIGIITDPTHEALIKQGIKKGMIIGEAINFSRTLSDLPAKDLYPESFIELVDHELKSKNSPYEITIFDTAKLTELGMGGILGVGQGSVQEPRLLILKYTPKILSQKTITLVGKGVTFDTGGISIKPSEGMEDMKSDMSGAAAIVSAFIGICQLESPYTIYGIAALAENMVDGNSIRPGDVLTFYNGKTAEIKNTDAEGRLVLADALSYASKMIKPDIMIDLATLTGACRIALGPVYAGLMSENNTLNTHIKNAGEITGDRCWQLPLESAYEPNMHSDVADICNIGTKGYKAGATMGGMFLREFVDPSIAWAHIDIATVATDCPFKNYISSFGATGFGVNLLIELLQNTKYLQ